MTHVYVITTTGGKTQICADHEMTHQELQMEAQMHSRQTTGTGNTWYILHNHGVV